MGRYSVGKQECIVCGEVKRIKALEKCVDCYRIEERARRKQWQTKTTLLS